MDRRKQFIAVKRNLYPWSWDLSQNVAKTSTANAKHGGTVEVEMLNIAGMSRHGWLGRALSDAGMGGFVRMAAYKCARYGTAFQRLDRWYPSSKTCSRCGVVKQSLLLSECTYRCVTRGCAGGRDGNAARNRRSSGRPGRFSPTGRSVRRTGYQECTVSEASTRQAVRFRYASEVGIAIGSGDRCSDFTTHQPPTGIGQPLAPGSLRPRLPSTTPAAACPLVDPTFLPCMRAGTDSAVFLPDRGPRGRRHDRE